MGQKKKLLNGEKGRKDIAPDEHPLRRGKVEKMGGRVTEIGL